MENLNEHSAWGVLRIALGLIFFWAFIDKLFGLGFATPPERAWLAGGSPTTGFLSNSPRGPFAEMFNGLAGQMWVDWLFMTGLCLIGLCLILGIGVRIATKAGVTMMVLMYLALIPPDNHPFLDEHIIYAIALMGIGLTNAGDHFGLGKWWSNVPLVQKYPILR